MNESVYNALRFLMPFDGEDPMADYRGPDRQGEYRRRHKSAQRVWNGATAQERKNASRLADMARPILEHEQGDEQ